MKPLFITLFLLGMGPAYAQITNGLKVPSKEQLSKIAVIKPRAGAPVPLKPAVDLSPFIPFPGMQGYTQGSCVGWTLTYGMMSYLKARQMNWSVYLPGRRLNEQRVFSPAFLYNHLTADPTCAEGIYMFEAMQFCVNQGGLSLNQFRYLPDRCDRKATSSEFASAAGNRLLSFNQLFNAFDIEGSQIDIDIVKEQLSNNNVVALGVHFDNDFYYNRYGNRTDPSRPFIWSQFTPDCPLEKCYHAMLCIGYNDTLQAFKLLNSWDTSFGNGGYVWVSYDVFRQAVKEAYVGFMKPRNAALAAPATLITTAIDPDKNFLPNRITDTNWIKKGYYREYDDLRVGCLDLNRNERTAVIRLTNLTDTVIITTTVLKVGEEAKIFEYGGRQIAIRAMGIVSAGVNPLTKAVKYELLYTNNKGVPFR